MMVLFTGVRIGTQKQVKEERYMSRLIKTIRNNIQNSHEHTATLETWWWMVFVYDLSLRD